MTADLVVVLSLEAWDGVWRRNQYLVDGLLRADPARHVLFVEPARDVVYDAVSRRLPRRGLGMRAAPGYEGRLTLLQPTKWLPRIAGPAADAQLRSSVVRAVRELGDERPTVWVNDPGWAYLVAATDWPSLYDITDDWVEAPRTPRARDRVVANEEILLDRCGAVVVCSDGLLVSRRRTRPDAVLIPNAVEVARYRRPAARPDDLPDGPVALYAGTLHEDRLDVDLVVRTGSALADRGGSCVLVGPDALSARHSSVLKEARGVVLLGGRHFHDVPGYLQHADALLVPHVVTAFTDSLDPIKRYEYLAVRRPVVSTPVAGFRELEGDPGVVVVDRTVFPQAVVDAVASPGAPSLSAPSAAVPDWSERVEAMREQLARAESAASADGPLSARDERA